MVINFNLGPKDQEALTLWYDYLVLPLHHKKLYIILINEEKINQISIRHGSGTVNCLERENYNYNYFW